MQILVRQRHLHFKQESYGFPYTLKFEKHYSKEKGHTEKTFL